jgi:hypothetical protein
VTKERTPALVLFWSKVQQGDGCWLWTGCRYPKGYGVFHVMGGPNQQIRIPAHRFAIQSTGIVIPHGMVVMHLCDNPPCVNPAHLRVGTYKENTQDCLSKGRHKCSDLRGSELPFSVLTEDIVREMRTRRGAGERVIDIAKAYNVDRGTVSSAISGTTWQHVEPIPEDKKKDILENQYLLVTMNGETMPLRRWCSKLGVRYHSIHQRIRKGWDPIRALTTPIRHKRENGTGSKRSSPGDKP